MMTFREFYDEAGRIVPPGQSYKVDITAWRHCYADGRHRPEVEFGAWDGSHYWKAPTPEALLEILRAREVPATVEEVVLGELPAVDPPAPAEVEGCGFATGAAESPAF
jgi:hypothetical protein